MILAEDIGPPRHSCSDVLDLFQFANDFHSPLCERKLLLNMQTCTQSTFIRP